MSSQEQKFNTKIITYRDGRSKYIYANRAIFVSESSKPSEEPQEPLFPSEKAVSSDQRPVASKDSLILPKEHKEKDVLRALARACNKVYDLIYENNFSHFYTLTFDHKRYSCKEARDILEKTKNFLENSVARKNFHYVLVAERHKKGGIHLHVIGDCPFHLVDSGTRIVKHFSKPVSLDAIRKKHIPPEDVGKIVYNVPEWRYGFTTAIEIDGDPAALSMYLTKYVTKDAKKIFGKYYWSSRNLIRSPKVSYTNTPGYQDIPAEEYEFCFGLCLKYRSDFSDLD